MKDKCLSNVVMIESYPGRHLRLYTGGLYTSCWSFIGVTSARKQQRQWLTYPLFDGRTRMSFLHRGDGQDRPCSAGEPSLKRCRAVLARPPACKQSSLIERPNISCLFRDLLVFRAVGTCVSFCQEEEIQPEKAARMMMAATVNGSIPWHPCL
jgi:hypothetical protein